MSLVHEAVAHPAHRGLLMRLLVGEGTPKEAVARGWGFFLAQSPGDGASNTAILLFWTTSASDPHAIACIITESPETG